MAADPSPSTDSTSLAQVLSLPGPESDATPGSFPVAIPAGWEQGRGAYGGLVLGLLARGMERAAADDGDDDRVLWTFNGEIPAPVVPGPAVVEVARLRRGNAITAYEARLLQPASDQPSTGAGMEVRARASAILGRERPVDVAFRTLEPPAHLSASRKVPLWDEIPVVPAAPPLAPAFIVHFELRPVDGFPFSGAERPLTEGWVRPHQPLQRVGAPETIALVDTYWPSLFPTFAAPRPMVTVGFGLHRTGVVPADPSAPLYFRGQSLVGAGGFVFEQRELWTAAGELVAVNPQTLAVIK
jgi:hypothetical protein